MFAIRSVSAGALLLSLAIPGMASARAAPAFLGSPYAPADAGCFSNYYGGVINTCATTKSWCIPLVVDAVGSYTVRAVAYSPGASSNVGCSVAGVNDAITSVWTSGLVYLSTFGSTQYITMTGGYVPANGQMYVCCDIGSGARVNGILW